MHFAGTHHVAARAGLDTGLAIPQGLPLAGGAWALMGKGSGDIESLHVFFLFLFDVYSILLTLNFPERVTYIYIYTIIRHVYEYTNHCWLIY